MKLAIDVYYKESGGKAVGLLFENWQDAEACQIIEVVKGDIAPYEPGQFYKRELPCILELMSKLNGTTIQEIIIDGYVYLDKDLKPGLGMYVYEALQGLHPIIGVAKTPYHFAKELAIQVRRGKSNNPLYITAVGMDPNEAASHIRTMAGDSRMPVLLKRLDQQTKIDNWM